MDSKPETNPIAFTRQMQGASFELTEGLEEDGDEGVNVQRCFFCRAHSLSVISV